MTSRADFDRQWPDTEALIAAVKASRGLDLGAFDPDDAREIAFELANGRTHPALQEYLARGHELEAAPPRGGRAWHGLLT